VDGDAQVDTTLMNALLLNVSDFVSSQTDGLGDDLVTHEGTKTLERAHVNLQAQLLFEVTSQREDVEGMSCLVELDEEVDVT
jgi:hypothetical protein